MAKRARTYGSEKRRKELSRQKKQEEKRQRRLSKETSTQQDTEKVHAEDLEAEQKN